MLVLKAILVTLLMFITVIGIFFGIAYSFGAPGIAATLVLAIFSLVAYIIYEDMKRSS